MKIEIVLNFLLNFYKIFLS